MSTTRTAKDVRAELEQLVHDALRAANASGDYPHGMRRRSLAHVVRKYAMGAADIADWKAWREWCLERAMTTVQGEDALGRAADRLAKVGRISKYQDGSRCYYQFVTEEERALERQRAEEQMAASKRAAQVVTDLVELQGIQAEANDDGSITIPAEFVDKLGDMALEYR